MSMWDAVEAWEADRREVLPEAQGLRAARRVAFREIGDASWADLIVSAYLRGEPGSDNEEG